MDMVTVMDMGMDIVVEIWPPELLERSFHVDGGRPCLVYALVITKRKWLVLRRVYA